MFEKLQELFKLLEEKFPYSTMSKEFRGKHHLTYFDGRVWINVWAENRLRRISVNKPEDFEDFDSIVMQFEQIIWNKP